MIVNFNATLVADVVTTLIAVFSFEEIVAQKEYETNERRGNKFLG